METTVGQLLLNDALPEPLRDHARVIDKKGLATLFSALVEKYPDRYAEINQKLHELAADTVTTHGREASLTLASLRTPPQVARLREELRKKVEHIAESGDNDKVIATLADAIESLEKSNYDEALAADNPLAVQVKSGSRGNASGLKSLMIGDVLFTDHKERPIPVPALRSFSEGLDPVQYWAGAYTARRGSISTKFATPKAGFLGKQLAMAAHRLVVTEADCGTSNGVPVDASDADNEGAVLASGVGGFKAGEILAPKTLSKLGNKRITVRSPMTCQAEGGVCQKCAGVRERGGFPPIGDNLGMAAAQAIAEPLAQGVLNVKHSGGKARGPDEAKAKTGLDLINQLVQVPKTFQGGAAISIVDGRVERVENAPQGGSYVTVSGSRHWVPPGSDLAVKKGDKVEAGDVISSGIPNPAEVTRHKGIGEGRRYFMDLFQKTLAENGFPSHRRNVELMARGLINHVRVTDLDGPGDTLPNDVAEYDSLVRGYAPRYGAKALAPDRAVGLYLEKPVLHYSIGTRITPRVASELKGVGTKQILAHADIPSFEPEMTRAMETLSNSEDWMVRLGGFHLKKGLTESVHRGRESAEHGTSFIPALAKGVDMGKVPASAGY
jgi:DNA-directed RNA polymerase subunit beta'